MDLEGREGMEEGRWETEEGGDKLGRRPQPPSSGSAYPYLLPPPPRFPCSWPLVPEFLHPGNLPCRLL